MSILLTTPGRHMGQMVGRSPYLQPVYVDGTDDLTGIIVRAEITGLGTNSLAAKIVDRSDRREDSGSSLSAAAQH